MNAPMDAKKARDIIDEKMAIPDLAKFAFNQGVARGYLAALEGPEVKALVDELKTILYSETCIPKDIAQNALADFRKEVSE